MSQFSTTPLAVYPAEFQARCHGNGEGSSTLPVVDPSSFNETTPFPPLLNDRILRAARRQTVDAVPVWCHRQAGRYLPEFREVRKQGDFFTMCRTPHLAAELTLQPIRRYALDAAIIFSDILVIPQALGMEVLMKESVGPVLTSPIRTPDDMARLKSLQEIDVKRDLKYVYDAIRLTRHSLKGTVPLIGFCGAPWTLFAYMVEGGGAKSYTAARTWLFKYPQHTQQVLSLITDVLVQYLVEQVRAGAQMLEIFDTWAGELTQECFIKFSLPYLKRIASEVKSHLAQQSLPDVPITLFPRCADYALAHIHDTEYDVVALGWSTAPHFARQSVANKVALQGNLDVAALYADEQQLRQAVRNMVDEFGVDAYIANLGHGMLPDHSPESVRILIDEVHTYSAEKIKQQKALQMLK